MKSGQAGDVSSNAIIELQNIDFDGEALRGRLLISTAKGTVRIDKRLIESISLILKGVLDCASGQELSFIKAGTIVPPRQEEDILALEPGYWYGKDVRIPLFDQHLLASQGRPECVDVDLMLHMLEGGSTPLRVRATRLSSPSVDAGVPAPDAGASSTGTAP
jgi:hypothetical protein